MLSIDGVACFDYSIEDSYFHVVMTWSINRGYGCPIFAGYLKMLPHPLSHLVTMIIYGWFTKKQV